MCAAMASVVSSLAFHLTPAQAAILSQVSVLVVATVVGQLLGGCVCNSAIYCNDPWSDRHPYFFLHAPQWSPDIPGTFAPVSRGWGQPWVIFDWDNIFGAYQLSLGSKDLGYSQLAAVIKTKVLEHAHV